MTDLDVKRLRRVVVLLLALADIAERVARRSFAIRWSVIWLLLPGEAIARDYAAGLTGSPAPSHGADIEVRPGDGADDALRLARSFRTIAATLMGVLEWLAASIMDAVAPDEFARPPRHVPPAIPLYPRQFPDLARLDSS